MDRDNATHMISALKKRLDRERKARVEAEEISERVTRDLYQLNRMKSEFIGTVSHELRTPITALIGMIETLKFKEIAADPKTRAEFLQRMGRQAQRLNRLVEQILATSALQTRKVGVVAEPIDLRDLIEQLINAIENPVVKLKNLVPPELPPLVSDYETVGSIVFGILENAVKFSPDGGEITLGASCEGNQFHLWIEDQGIGMSKDEMDHVFEPFWQADASDTRRFGGVGLGLHLVKLMVELLSGEVSVESEKGKGSRFAINLRSLTAAVDSSTTKA